MGHRKAWSAKLLAPDGDLTSILGTSRARYFTPGRFIPICLGPGLVSHEAREAKYLIIGGGGDLHEGQVRPSQGAIDVWWVD